MLNIKQLKTTIMTLTIFLLISCSGLQENKTKKDSIYVDYITQQKLESIDSITAFRFHGWGSLDYEHLIISTKFNKPHLVILGAFCPDLKFANALIINNHGNRLQAKFDSISVTSEPRIKCLIKSIYPITREQRKALAALKK